jgi:DMSO/TMAO reductase YedYZ molybdopterin-dependent catalytic subunit
MRRWNEMIDAAMFSPHRLAPELPASATTPESAFPAYYISDSIPVSPANWTLNVGGLVRRPMILTLAQIQKMPRTDMRVQHHCVEGWSAVASWHGVRLSEVAKMARLDPRVRYVEFRSFDSHYWSSWDLGSAMHPQTLLAYGFNHGPLYAEHGAPLRVLFGGQARLQDGEVADRGQFSAGSDRRYWENQGYEWFAGV